MIITFERYCQRKELSALLKESGYDPSDYNLDYLLEAGMLNRFKKGMGNLGRAAVVGGALMSPFGQAQAQAPSYQAQAQAQTQDAKPYDYRATSLQGNDIAKQQFDKSIAHYNKTGQFPDDQLDQGSTYKMSAVDELVSSSTTIIKDGLEKTIMTDSFVSVSRQERLEDGRVEITASISGQVMASSKEEAMEMVEKKVQEIIEAQGWEVNDIQELSGEMDMSVNPAEAAGMSVPIKVQVKYVISEK